VTKSILKSSGCHTGKEPKPGMMGKATMDFGTRVKCKDMADSNMLTKTSMRVIFTMIKPMAKVYTARQTASYLMDIG